MKTAVVTGATGFIGGALTKKLLSNGVKVYGIDMNEERLREFVGQGNFIPVKADFSQYEHLNEMIEDDIDVFFHFAWSGVFGDAFKNYRLQLDNARFACCALEQAIKIGAKKFVMAGTYNEFEIQNIVFSDDLCPRYTCIYATSKLAADMICKTLAYQNGIQYNSGLIVMAYGEKNRSKMLANVIIDSFNKGVRPKLVEGNNLYDMIYIDDIVDAFIAIAEKGKDLKSYYVGHRKLKTFKKWINDIRDILAPDMSLQFGEYQDTQHIDFSKIDLDALYHDTGFECKSDFEESILKTAEWLRSIY